MLFRSSATLGLLPLSATLDLHRLLVRRGRQPPQEPALPAPAGAQDQPEVAAQSPHLRHDVVLPRERADAAAATFAAVGKSSNGGGRSAAEKFSDDWDKEREAGATSIQRAEWLAMSTTERDAEMAVRGERATRVYTFQSRWNQLLDTLANKQKMMHGKAFKGFWDTRDLLQHVQTMEREVFKWLEGHKREVTKAEIKLVALMERRGESKDRKSVV